MTGRNLTGSPPGRDHILDGVLQPEKLPAHQLHHCGISAGPVERGVDREASDGRFAGVGPLLAELLGREPRGVADQLSDGTAA
ncbi:MAG TPA: hypothetical protein VGM60_17555 [Pseudonocardia sp.]|jgi:hypothetical protein